MFEKQKFVADIANAIHEHDPQSAITELVQQAIEDPAQIIKELGPLGRGRSEQLHLDAGLTITNVIWGSEMWVPPHDHTMWAVIGVYQGQEDNTFWREEDGQLTQMGGVSMRTGDVRKLGKDAIHSVRNPTIQLTGAIHIYGGDFFGAIPDRHSWDIDTLERGPYDYAYINSLRDEANAHMESLQQSGTTIN